MMYIPIWWEMLRWGRLQVGGEVFKDSVLSAQLCCEPNSDEKGLL